MGYNSYISGTIEGISEESYELIREDLEQVFENVTWCKESVWETKSKGKEIVNKGGAIEIGSYGRHHDEFMHPLFDRIAFCIDDNGGGYLDFHGEEAEDMGSIYFAARRWRQIWAQIEWPQNPFYQPNEKKAVECFQ